MNTIKKVLTTTTVVGALALAGTVATIQPAQATQPCTVNLSSYTNGSSDASAGLRLAAHAVQNASNWNGGTICVDRAYTVNSTVQLDELVGPATPANSKRVWNKVRLSGTGAGAAKFTKTTNGPMFRMNRIDVTRDAPGVPKWYAGVYLENVAYENVGFEMGAAATGYIWELSSGAITTGQWHSINAKVLGNGGIMYVGRLTSGKGGAQYHTNSWRDVRLEGLSKTNPYVMMRFASAHNYVNGNTFDTVWAHHHGNDKAVFFEFKPSGGVNSTSGGQYTNTTLRAITGEQNLGGLAHFYGINGISLNAIAEWDGICPGYAKSIIGVNPNAGTPSRSLNITGSGSLAHSNYAPVRNNARVVWVDSTTVGVQC